MLLACEICCGFEAAVASLVALPFVFHWIYHKIYNLFKKKQPEHNAMFYHRFCDGCEFCDNVYHIHRENLK